jgi:hypothetical protein
MTDTAATKHVMQQHTRAASRPRAPAFQRAVKMRPASGPPVAGGRCGESWTTATPAFTSPQIVTRMPSAPCATRPSEDCRELGARVQPVPLDLVRPLALCDRLRAGRDGGGDEGGGGGAGGGGDVGVVVHVGGESAAVVDEL